MRQFFNKVLTCFILLMFFSIPLVLASSISKVAILPFNLITSKDMRFVQDGIYDMLTSRLSLENEIVILDKYQIEKVLGQKDVNDEQAVNVAKILGVDYILYGSLTEFDGSISIDAKMLKLDNGTLSFFNQHGSMAELISKVSEFALDINKKAFGRDLLPTEDTKKQNVNTYSDPNKLINIQQVIE